MNRSTISWSTDQVTFMSSEKASWKGARYDSATMITLHPWRRRVRRGRGEGNGPNPVGGGVSPSEAGAGSNFFSPPLAIHSPCISIRKFPSRRYDMAGMIENGTMTAAMGRLLEIAARSRLNVLVSGGTGSGKTTLLNALSQFIDHGERIVTIEDAAELQLQQPHVISLETRPPSLEGT